MSLKGPTWIGVGLVLLFLVGFGVWATIVPLAGGAIANGVLGPDGSKRTVQHLEGGIIRRLHVRDGDIVRTGQALLVLESIQPRAKYDQLFKQQRDLRIKQVRLAAEVMGRSEVHFPQDVMKQGRDASSVMSSQRRLFHARLAAHRSKRKILEQRILQLNEQISGYKALMASATRQIELINREVKDKARLFKKGYLAKPTLLRLQRMQAEIHGRLGQYRASISQAFQQIGETQSQLVSNQAERQAEIASQSEKVRAELGAIEEQLLASKDILNRTIITAPVDGKVVNLMYKTESGVVQAGTPILDIVPTDEKLIIDARISPMDIDVVRSGLRAQIQLSAYSARSTPRVEGVVSSVSADRIIDKSTNQAYYNARVEVDRDALQALDPSIKLLAGMPADVLIVTGNRTLVNYLLDPIFKAVWKTFREV